MHEIRKSKLPPTGNSKHTLTPVRFENLPNGRILQVATQRSGKCPDTFRATGLTQTSTFTLAPPRDHWQFQVIPIHTKHAALSKYRELKEGSPALANKCHLESEPVVPPDVRRVEPEVAKKHVKRTTSQVIANSF